MDFLDSFKRHSKSLDSVIRFGLSSCLCLVVDGAVFSVVCVPAERFFGRTAVIAVSQTCAIAVSGHLNFFINRRLVFREEGTRFSYWKYWSLVGINLVMRTLATAAVSALLDAHGIAITAVKLCEDIALFAFSYVVQKRIVFKGGGQWKRKTDCR